MRKIDKNEENLHACESKIRKKEKKRRKNENFPNKKI